MGLIYIYDQLLLVHVIYNLAKAYITEEAHWYRHITFGFCQPIS